MLALPTDRAAAEVRRPASLDDALADLAELGDGGAPLAGATWIMRGHVPRRAYVALGGLAELRGPLGALRSHRELAADASLPQALREAAGASAFPAVRAVATLGGNLATAGFPEADLVPALLALDATVLLAGTPEQPIAAYLADRGGLVTGVRIPDVPGRRSAFARLTVRGAGEYAVASVAVCADAAGGVTVAVGAVEETARTSAAAAAVLAGGELDEDAATRAGEAAAAELAPRDGRDAPARYRTAVLPALLRRAVARLA